MKRRQFVSWITSIGVVATGVPRMSLALNYDDLIVLDAEDLAETGIKTAYDQLLPALNRYAPSYGQFR
ncbi:MAG TPA: hypothetical protein VK629_09160 [Steroidobacteraceae bacterium]|nr:hypothetical protein [Steroidobacteraceae bacterium]